MSTPLATLSPFVVQYSPMKIQEMKLLASLYKANETRAQSLEDCGNVKDIAIMATVIDTLRKDLEGLAEIVKPPAVLKKPEGDIHPDSEPQPPEDNGDPNPTATEVCKRLGALGLTNLDELKGYRIDKRGHVLLQIKGRMADSGWLADSRHFKALKETMMRFGVFFPDCGHTDPVTGSLIEETAEAPEPAQADTEAPQADSTGTDDSLDTPEAKEFIGSLEPVEPEANVGTNDDSDSVIEP